ncbi:unnamed protein product [Clonostachys rosea]|uniref:GPI inositol-deacylase n=1 Tax=Bionectria ochroleuca TaxID=29856 RepID=A0ABY6UK79_BIOOC|nr:unnamed protein product [Clonostachys rosea]
MRGGLRGNRSPDWTVLVLGASRIQTTMFKRFSLAKLRHRSEPAGRGSSSSSTEITSTDPVRGGATSTPRVTRETPLTVLEARVDSSPAALGLHVLYQPSLAALDIVFVHGLGGHSHNTWTKNHDPSLFWPAKWLPLEPEIGISRIMTFGYNANWRGSTKNISTITDFAKDLLFQLRFARDRSGSHLDIGSRPIIFVVHSMGGLVVKKAYLLGIHDETYKAIVESISAVIFLATPHRGTHLAETLSNILSATFQSSKSFISDLNKGSFAIEDINEQFRHFAPRLSIWSFYETLATSIGPRKIMVLEKDSSVLGYPSEISKPLHADHKSICKYDNPADENYIAIKNAITYLVSDFMRKVKSEAGVTEVEIKATVADLFRGCITSEDDYNVLSERRIPGTCSWIFEEIDFLSWMEPSNQSLVLWYTALPGNGKSTLSTCVIDYLKSSPNGCQFFHFKYSDPGRRSAINCLRSLAFQLAKDIRHFGRLLCEAPRESLGLESGDTALIWQNAFQNTFAQSKIEGHIYWIIDGLDECDEPLTLLNCFKELSTVAIPIRILILSRNTGTLSSDFDRLAHNVPVNIIEKRDGSHNLPDIGILARQGLDQISCGAEFREQLCQSITKRSEGNFLWTKLILDEFMYCHTEKRIQEVLKEVPDDMTLVYERMEKSLLQSGRRANEPLIKSLIEWTICAQRSLNLSEMSQALEPEFTGFLDLKRTIKDACGQFIQVDESGNISMLHYSTSEYFSRSTTSRFSVNLRVAHTHLFLKTNSALEEPTLQWRLIENRHTLQSSQPFVFYSAISWSYHLDHCQPCSPETLDRLVSFFRSPAVLCWIHILSLLRRLEVLTKVASILGSIIQIIRMEDAANNSKTLCPSDLELLEDWVTDLNKIVGKFGQTLVMEPEVIYNLIPALSPGQTAISRQFRDYQTTIDVLGNEDRLWNGNLGRFALPSGSRALKIACTPKYIAVLEFGGIVRIWDPSNFLEIRCISHMEPVTTIAFSTSGTKLATCGLQTTKIWSVISGEEMIALQNPPLTKVMEIAFAEKDRKLLFGGDDNTVRSTIWDGPTPKWQVVHPELILKKPPGDVGTIMNSPMCLAFSDDRKYVGASYRGAPLSVWRLEDGKFISKCKRSKDTRLAQLNGARRPSTTWFAVDRFTWNPVSGHVLGIYRDGCIFKWHPFTGDSVELRKPADGIAVSSNGKLFATSSSDGSVRVWNFTRFTIIYQLSTEDLVTDLTFSPNSQRFYDLRGGVVNAWEPDAVTRFYADEQYNRNTEREDKCDTEISKLSEEKIVHTDCVTAICPSPNGTEYCVGFENGTVLLFEDPTMPPLEVATFGYPLEITHLAWSNDGLFIAAANLAGEVIVKEVHRDRGRTRFSLLPKLEARSKEINRPYNAESFNIEGVIFSLDSKLICLWTERECFIFTVETGLLQAYLEAESGIQRKWFRHPNEKDTVFAYSSEDVQAYSWKTLTKLASIISTRSKPPIKLDDGSLEAKITGFEPRKRLCQDKKLTRVIAPQTSESLMLCFAVGSCYIQVGICNLSDLYCGGS